MSHKKADYLLSVSCFFKSAKDGQSKKEETVISIPVIFQSVYVGVVSLYRKKQPLFYHRY